MTLFAARHSEPGRSLLLSVVEGSFWAVYTSVVGGALLTGYALALGADDFQIGLMTGLASAAAIGALAGARHLGRCKSRKPMLVRALTLSRLAWLPLCLLPFLSLVPAAGLALLLGIVLVSALAGHFADTAWMSWMTDLVPPTIRGRYFSWRNSILGALCMASAFGAGKAYDGLKTTMDPLQAFAPVFVVAVVCGVVSIAILSRISEPPLQEEPAVPPLQLLRLPFRHRHFRTLLLFWGLWTLATGIAAPFFQPQMIKHLHMSYTAIGLYGAVSGLAALLFQPFWGHLIDRIGNRAVLRINALGAATLPLYWFFATPDCLWPIWVNAVASGLFGPGILLGAFNLAMGTAPRQNRAAYLASFRLVGGLTAFAAALLGGAIAQATQGLSWHGLGQAWGNYHLAFAISFVAQLLLCPLASWLHEERLEEEK